MSPRVSATEVVLVLLLLLVAPGSAQEESPSAPTTIEQRVDAALRKSFSGLTLESRQAAARKIQEALVGSRASARRSEEILRALPEGAENRGRQVYFRLEEARHLKLPVDADFVQRGYLAQTDYLAAEVARAGRTEWTEASRSAVEAQIGTLSDVIRRSLLERLQGPGAEALVASFVDPLRESWRSSLDRPFSTFLDSPIATTDLERAILGIREQVQRFAPVVLSAADAANPAQLQELGVTRFLEDVKKVAFRTSASCFPEFSEFQSRTDAWSAELEKQVDEQVGKGGAGIDLVDRLPKPDPRRAGSPASARPVPTAVPSLIASGEEAKPARPLPPARPVDADDPWRWFRIVGGGAIALVVLALLMRRRAA